ncbi:MAG: GNAT family N-acetyltransferase [Butyrivibrio sp.]
MQLIQASKKTQYNKIHSLYKKSFPLCEKKPFSSITKRQKLNKVDIWYIEDKGEFVGLAITMKSKDMVLLDYFAIDTSMRSEGYGSKALKMLQDYYRDCRFFLEIESVYENAANQQLRERRKAFYLKNNMTEMNIKVNLFGTDMEILGYGCNFTYEEYLHVYEEVYGKRKSDKIKKLL